mmetsp:Transcript_15122/g.36311  ORF Transcript_15122/g.36311 Transcript_15122/m.36311 type:complete len:552 (-) Transcript_15122:275-1930(-)|eukprot:CAMPEP_0181107054 /NCGR_PEP_ID=MMETSP1071-20121207/16868_1 /TAXON_ID=35127 /ORGANISM="Thalassiosira sp., Strain NH16" /LENGTH=551 /DNA_ID=CAMNT_0023190517 /DNA_START=141 /DNA_END=1796 /DNA_ORIENTATION=-
MTALFWYSYYLFAFILPSLSSLTAPSYSPSILRGRTLFVSSWKIDTHRGKPRPRAKANHKFVELGIGRGRHGIVRGGADSGNVENSEANSSKSSWGISLSLFLTYLTVMGAKCALPSTLSMLTSPNSGLAHHSAVLSRQDVMSRLLALSTVSIAAGKLLLGPFIDSLGGVPSLQIALSALCICLGSIGLGARTCPTLTSFAIYWIVVDFAFSSCWAACVKTIRDCMSEQRWAREIGRLAMAARMGNALSFAFFASLLQWASAGTTAPTMGADRVDFSWRLVFRASSAIQLIPLLMLSYFGRKGKSDSGMNEDKQATSMSKSTMKESLAILYHQSRTPEFWLHLISRSMIMVLVSFLLFIPSFMVQCYGISSASSARVGSMFALGCLLSVSTLSELTYPSVHRNSNIGRPTPISFFRQKAYFMLAFLALATMCLALQRAFLQNIINLTPAVGTFLMFLFGFSLAIPFYLPSSMFALKRGGKDGSATIADAFDVCGFGLLAVFNGYVARVLNAKTKRAWVPVFSWMLGGSIVAMTSLFGAVYLEGMREIERKP